MVDDKNNTILIDAIFINNGGGKILLDYLYDMLSQIKDNKFVFLIDSRLKHEYQLKQKSNLQIFFLEGFSQRSTYYKKNKINFRSVLCFGNIPPNVKLRAKVLTYFHQPMYLSIPKEFGIIETIKFKMKIAVLKLLKKNTDYWLVQNNFIKDALQKKFNIPESEVVLLPFYPSFSGDGLFSRKQNSFIFVSNANLHKNHQNLINAFCRFYDREKQGLLTLTVNETFPEVLKLIQEKTDQGYPIENIGFVSRDQLYKEYQSHQYLVFPSLAESFGLGLVEAIENGCKIIASDLPYAHQACKPSILIKGSQNENDIFDALVKSINYDEIPFSQQKVHNEIEKLINLLKN